MKINGISAEKIYGVQQWTVTPEYCEIKNNSEWNEGALSPLMVQSLAGMKKLKLDVIIRGKSRAEIWEKAGNFVAKLLKPCTIELDGLNHQFYMVLQGASQVERNLQRWHKATLELIGYEHGSETSMQTAANKFVVFNPGNLMTPAIIELTPQTSMSGVLLSGLARSELTGEDMPIGIGNLKQGSKVIIDGETGLITENGENKFPEVNLWDLPSLLPGANEISLSSGGITTTIKYKPRYL